GRPTAPPRGVKKGGRDRGQDGVWCPPRPRAPLEGVEAELAFQFLILLLDRPALMRQADEPAQRGRRGQVDEVILQSALAPCLLFAEQPELRREAAAAPVVRRGHADRGEAGVTRGLGAMAPRDASPCRPRPLGN